MALKRTIGWLAGPALSALSGLATAQEPAIRRPLPTAEEKLVVREVELLVGLPRAIEERVRKGLTLRPEEVVVFEEGFPCPVTRIAPAAMAAAGRGREVDSAQVVIYIDRTLAAPGSVARAAAALASQATALTRLGKVEIAVADSEIRVTLESTGEPALVEQALKDLETDALRQGGRLLNSSLMRSTATPGLYHIRPQWDQLIAFLADHRAGGPKILLLVSDGDVPALGNLSADPAAGMAQATPSAVVDAVKVIAAYGWVTVPISLRPLDLKPLPRTQSDSEKWQETLHGGKPRFTFNFTDLFEEEESPTLRSDELFYDHYILPRLAPLRAVAEDTSGAMLLHQDQVEAELVSLSRRWRLWYSSSAPLDGQMRRLQVHLAVGEDRLRSPLWVRTSTPESVADARLRTMLSGSQKRGTLPVRISGHRQTDKRTAEERLSLEIHLSRRELPDVASFGPVRISFAAAGGKARHEWVAEPILTASGWNYSGTFDLPAQGGAVAVVVEDLAREMWQGMLVESTLEAAGGRAEGPDSR